MQAIVAALFMNIYIVGLNQLSDIEIDKVWQLSSQIHISWPLYKLCMQWFCMTILNFV